MAEPECDDFGIGAAGGEGKMRQIQFHAHKTASEPHTRHGRCSAAEKRVEHEVSGIRRGQEAAFHQRDRFLRGMFPVRFLPVAGALIVQTDDSISECGMRIADWETPLSGSLPPVSRGEREEG